MDNDILAKSRNDESARNNSPNCRIRLQSRKPKIQRFYSFRTSYLSCMDNRLPCNNGKLSIHPLI